MGGSDRDWACAACARKCSKVHGRRSPPSQLSFFKIMLGPFEESLIVPPKFARLLRDFVGQKFYLENSDGNRWQIKLLKVDNFLAFQQGWNEFVSYHSIQVGEIVIFKYTSPCSFGVQIFGISGCERSHFCGNIDKHTHKRCSTDYSTTCKDGGRNEACKFGSCIQEKASSKKVKPIRSNSGEYFTPAHMHCKTNGEFQERKRSSGECFGLRKDGRTTDRDSSKKRKAMVSIPCETLSTPRSADTLQERNMQQISSSLIMANNSKSNMPTTTGYSEVTCIVVGDDMHKEQDESQKGILDSCDNVNMRPVNNASEKWEKGRQMAQTDVPANVNANQVEEDPELPCKLSKTDSQKDEEMIAILPSELVLTGVGTENTDKSMITEKRPFHSMTSKFSKISCSEKCEGNENEPPAAESIVNITSSLTEMGISLTDCMDIAPICSEMSLSNGVGLKSLPTELPISGLSNEKITSEEETSAAVKDGILDKASTVYTFINYQDFPSLKCIGDMAENLSADDVAACRILVDEEGTCYIIKSSIIDPVANSICADISYNAIADTKCNNTFTPIVREVSLHSDIVSKDLCSADIIGSSGVERANRTVITSTSDNDYSAQTQSCHLNTMAGNASAIPEESDAFSVRDAAEQPSGIPTSQEGSHTMNRSSDGVKQDPASHENKKLSCPREANLEVVKAEITDPDDFSSSCSNFSLLVKNLSWHELSEDLPCCGRFRHERKVILLRDPVMRVWPVLYQENLVFTGFLGGWEAFVTANSVREGDTCSFEPASDCEPILQVRISRAQLPN